MNSAIATATPTAEKLWAALQQGPGSTAKELAESAGIGGSTARKLLVALERTGSAYRLEGGAGGSAQRPADRWYVLHTPANANAAAAEEDPAAEAEAGDEVLSTPAEPTAPTVPAEEADTALEPAEADAPAEPADTAAAGDTAPDTEAAAEPEDSERAEPDTAEPVVKGKRLAPGALRAMVQEFLTDCAGREFGPTELGRNLQHSVGAIHNALEKLVADGIVVKTCQAPKRYMIPQIEANA
ncbi:helix-turn-helix domain-containing protein [Nocardia terpenica]|uniref:MarR family transcriptional regulator n=1 Tax=Nocardia terpenica TaxID=455432 RepID=A0A291RC87_9NOCA|nr:MarR family transcriptional regulator [Nocardia terpenica]ATL65171.1 MarR family transcriptional regulator [Nocardia terpenica]